MFPSRFFPASYFAPRYFPRNGDSPAPSGGNYVQRVIGRTTRAEDFIRIDRVDVDGLRRKREDEEIIIL